ncbi:hypothetical protein [Nocardiopsis coralliicola]
MDELVLYSGLVLAFSAILIQAFWIGRRTTGRYSKGSVGYSARIIKNSWKVSDSLYRIEHSNLGVDESRRRLNLVLEEEIDSAKYLEETRGVESSSGRLQELGHWENYSRIEYKEINDRLVKDLDLIESLLIQGELGDSENR